MKKTPNYSQLSLLADIPNSLSAVARSEKIQARAAEVNFDWQDVDQVIEVLKSEVIELQEAITKQYNAHEIITEFGDILFTRVNLARHLKTTIDDALHIANEKFIRRFQHIERTLQLENKNFTDLNFEQLLAYWNQAKQGTTYE